MGTEHPVLLRATSLQWAGQLPLYVAAIAVPRLHLHFLMAPATYFPIFGDQCRVIFSDPDDERQQLTAGATDRDLIDYEIARHRAGQARGEV